MEPKKNCNICNRLVDYRNQNKILFPDFYNDRVVGIGSLSSELLIVGLAPGLRGANRTGKIFNDDLPSDIDLSNEKVVALDNEALGLVLGRDPLTLVQIGLNSNQCFIIKLTF